eukprot:9472213-Pyramimonas_sp.AAC.1
MCSYIRDSYIYYVARARETKRHNKSYLLHFLVDPLAGVQAGNKLPCALEPLHEDDNGDMSVDQAGLASRVTSKCYCPNYLITYWVVIKYYLECARTGASHSERVTGAALPGWGSTTFRPRYPACGPLAS